MKVANFKEYLKDRAYREALKVLRNKCGFAEDNASLYASQIAKGLVGGLPAPTLTWPEVPEGDEPTKAPRGRPKKLKVPNSGIRAPEKEEQKIER